VSKKHRYFFEIAYNGTPYHGWQTQPNALAVQEVVDRALATYFREDIETLGCGRTDTGVHASQFFLHVDLVSQLDFNHLDKVVKSINSLLPHDIALLNVFQVQENAHARFDATLRSYQYHIHFKKNPFKTDLSWLFTQKLDVEAMKAGAEIIKQYDDFGAFCKSNADNFTNICTINHSYIEEVPDGLIYHIGANRFLRNMVRAIVGTLIDAGKGKIRAEDIHQIIQSQNRSEAGASVPACGLFLTQVKYPYIK
jgi:tRNA pseudouridine38-40 synthase